MIWFGILHFELVIFVDLHHCNHKVFVRGEEIQRFGRLLPLLIPHIRHSIHQVEKTLTLLVDQAVGVLLLEIVGLLNQIVEGRLNKPEFVLLATD
ncbi:hypothetical protein D3C73_669260 [compost metagenome]